MRKELNKFECEEIAASVQDIDEALSEWAETYDAEEEHKAIDKIEAANDTIKRIMGIR